MSKRIRKRKCRHCGELFLPDYRNAQKQKYCSKPKCRKASKAASQARWLAKEENQDYFSGPENVKRVQQWRKCNPDYQQRKAAPAPPPLQDHCTSQLSVSADLISKLNCSTLQDHCEMQLSVLVGLISKLTGSTLQDDIANTARNLQQLGDDILNPFSPNPLQGDYHAKQNCHSP